MAASYGWTRSISFGFAHGWETRKGGCTKRWFCVTDGSEAPGAIETVLAALSACVAHYARDFFGNAEKAPETLTVDSEANLTEDRVRFEDIRIAIGLDIPKLEAEIERRLLKHIEKCPIHGALG